MTHTKAKKNWVEEIEKRFIPKPRQQEVPLSLIIPTYNCSVSLDITLSTIQRQKYTPLEVIIVDAGSTDKTGVIISQYGSLITRVYSTANYNLPEMINRGVALATGLYICSIFPNSHYISDHALDLFAEAALAHDYPDMIACKALVRSDLAALTRAAPGPLHFSSLQKGAVPTPFVACWFKRDFFNSLGKLDARYQMRFSLDFFCKIAALNKKNIITLERTLVDFSFCFHLLDQGLAQVAETGKILRRRFGFWVAIKWLFSLRFGFVIQLLWKYLKRLIFEKS